MPNLSPDPDSFSPSSYPSDHLLHNPYAKDPRPTVRISADIPEEEYAFFKGVFPFRGVTQALINTILYAIIDELRRSGVLHYDPTYSDWLVDRIKSRAFLHRQPLGGTPGQESRPDGRHGVGGIRQAPSTPEEAPGVSSSDHQVCETQEGKGEEGVGE